MMTTIYKCESCGMIREFGYADRDSIKRALLICVECSPRSGIGPVKFTGGQRHLNHLAMNVDQCKCLLGTYAHQWHTRVE